MRRVLLVTHRAVAGGAQMALAALAARLPDHGWEPAVAVGEAGVLEDWLRAHGTPVRRAVPAGVARWEADEPGAAAGIDLVVAAALEHGAEAVVGLCAEGHRLAGPAAARLGLPAVWWRMLTPRNRPYERAAAAIPVAAVACLNPAAVAAQRALTPGVPVAVIPPGIDAAAVSARRGSGRALRSRLAAGSGPLVGIVGRLDPAKGQDDFLRAAARIALERPDARFAVVGGAIVGHEGDLAARLRALAAELGLSERVTFAGHVADALPWLDALDVAVVASHHEAFGLVCAEALALGVPVVATAADGPAAILRGGRDGLLVPVGEPAALAAAIARLLDDRRLAAAFAAAGPARAAALDDRATARAMAALLERVSAEPRAAAGSGAAHAVPAARA